MMKIKVCLIMAIVCATLASCGDSEKIDSWLQGESQKYSINRNIRTEKLPAVRAYDDWTATVGYGTADTGWLTLDKESGKAGVVELTAYITANQTTKYRSATVTVSCHGESLKFQFSQSGTDEGDAPKPSVSARVAKITVTSFDTGMHEVYQETLAFQYSGTVITGADYYSYDKEALNESNVVISIDRPHAGSCIYTFKEAGMPDVKVPVELDVANRTITVNENSFEYNKAGYLSKRIMGEKTWLYDVDTESNLLIVTSDSKLTYQFNPSLALRQDCNLDVNQIVMMTMSQRGQLKYAVLAEKGRFGISLPYVLYKAVVGNETYNFNPQLDKSNGILSLDLYHHYNDLTSVFQKQYVITYTD